MKFKIVLLAVLGHSMVCSYNNKRCLIVILIPMHRQKQQKESPSLHSYLVRRHGKKPVTSQAEILNPNLSVILYLSLITLTQFILKPLVSNKYSGMITMKPFVRVSYPLPVTSQPGLGR